MKSTNYRFIGIPFLIGLLSLGLTARAAEQWPSNSVFAKPGKIPVVNGYLNSFMDRGLGIEVGVDWSMLHWKCDKSFSDQILAPRVALVYSANDIIDIRALYKYISAKDMQDGVDGDVDLSRFGVGARAWFHVGGTLYPFASLDVTYYLLNMKNGSGERGMPGLSAEIGLAYVMTDWLLIHIAMQGETSFANGRVDVNGKEENFQVNGIGANLGLNIFF